MKVLHFFATANFRMYKAGIQVVFMFGLHPEIIGIGKSAVAGEESEGFEDAFRFLVGSQYIKSHDGQIFKVVIGSGMGLLSSDDISSYLFYCMVEKWLLTEQVRAKYGLMCYMRFKDDLFYCLDSSYEVRMVFWHELRTHARFFKIKKGQH